MCDKENPYEPKTKEDAERALKLFCAKFKRISEYSFFKAEKIEVRHEHNVVQGCTKLIYEGPTEEQIDAVLLHLRFFIGKNEGSSTVYLETCFNLLGAKSESVEKLRKILKLRSDWRDSDSKLHGIKNCDLFAILIWGGRIHANDKGRLAQYDELMVWDLIKAEEEFHLSRIIDGFMRIISQLHHLISTEVISRTAPNQDSPSLPLGST